MRNIKFKSQNETQTLFATTVRKNVMNYFKENNISPYANWQMKLKSFLVISMYMVPFVLILTVPMGGWIALGLAALMGIGKAGIGMAIMHDANHGAYSRKRWVNNLMGATIYILGSHVLNWKVQHNVNHHTYTNIEGLDSDLVARGPIRMSERSPVKKMHKYQHIYAFFLYGLLTLSKLVRDFVLLSGFNRDGTTVEQKCNPTQEMAKLIFFKIVYFFSFIGLPIMLTDFTVWQVLGGFLFMHWVAGCILSTVFQLAHIVEGVEQPSETSTGVIENDWIIHELETTANFGRDNWLLSWYVGGLNFQVEHHLFPYICHVHYPKIAPIVEQTAKEFGYAYNCMPTLSSAIYSHYRKLKTLGTLQRAA